MKSIAFFVTLCSILCVSVTSLQGQWQQSILQEDGSLRVKSVPAPVGGTARSAPTREQLPGYPKGFVANPMFKNFRNVTLADINADGRAEVLVGIDDQFYVFEGGQILWQKALDGIAIYPPSVADIDNDGDMEIVQLTGQVSGNAYIFQHDGTDYPNWPMSFDDHLLLTAPVLADLDNDKIMEVIFLERIFPGGNVQILRLDGSAFNANWPVALAATPAVTPSVGDVDNDGALEVVVNSSQARYVLTLDGQFEPGFPLETHPRQRYAFQSPILADLDDNQDLEIIGATHGDNLAPLPEFYVMEHTAANFSGWPVFIPDQSWTFNTPTVVKIEDDYRIFMSRPIGTDPADMLYGWDANANLLPGFPIVKPGGLEGIISVADIDGDEEMELVFGSNLIDENGRGRIHAYEMDGSGDIAGFPIETPGWTFMNGAALDDIDGNGTMDLVALSYISTFGEGTDSIFINAYDLGAPYSPEKVLWGTYKGSNRRNGLVGEQTTTPVRDPDAGLLQARLFPNPVKSHVQLELQLERAAAVEIDLLDATGRLLMSMDSERRSAGLHHLPLSLRDFSAGSYLIRVMVDGRPSLLPMLKY